MKFDFRRLSPAVLTSLGLLFLALLFLALDWDVLGWILGLAGLALNVVAVAVTEVPDSAGDGTRRVEARPGAADRSARERLALRDSASTGKQSRGGSSRATPLGAETADVVRDADGLPVETPEHAAPAVRDGKPGKGDKAAYSRAGSTAVPGSATSSTTEARTSSATVKPSGGTSSIRR